MKLQLWCWPGMQASEDLTGMGKSSSKRAHSHGCWHEALAALPADGRRLSLLPHRPLQRAAWASSPCGSWLLPEQVTEREQDVSHCVFDDLALEVTSHRFHDIRMLTKSALLSVKENGYTRAKMLWGRGHWGSSLRQLPHTVKVRS